MKTHAVTTQLLLPSVCPSHMLSLVANQEKGVMMKMTALDVAQM